MNSFEKDYIDADKYVVVNDNDPDLKPIVLRLPNPPPIRYIDGYGEPFREQRFKRLTIPRRLIDLEAKAMEVTKQKLSSNVNNVVTLLKIQKTFWEMLMDDAKEYKKEIDFIRQVWWHRRYGYWFFNRGKPTYITGWHFYYLNFYTMDTSDGSNRPEYRDRDRKEFLFFQYQYTTNESFARLDSEGYAIPNDDGTYETKEVVGTNNKPLRICFGGIQPKNRRSGNTNKALSIGLEIVSRTLGTDGGGIQSYSENNAQSHFKDKLMPAFEKLPIWLKPNSVSGKTADTLKFQSGKNDFGEPSLGTKIDYATTASSKYYDGKKLMFILVDESGKCFGKDTEIRMYDGSIKKVQDIKIGDVLMGDDSTPRNVTSVTVGYGDMYKIVPNNGKSWTCNSEHILPLRSSDTGVIAGAPKGSYFKKTVKDFLRMNNRQQKASVMYKRGVKFMEQKHVLEPYFLGLWLGDGSSNTSAITNIDEEVIDYLKDFVKKNDMELVWRDEITCNIKSKKNYQDKTRTNFIVLGELRKLGVLGNKHIPKSYIMDSIENRLQLLAGLIDSDGYALTGNKRGYEITQKRKNLASEIRRVALDLGFSASMKEKMATMKRDDGSVYKCKVYRVMIYGLDLWRIPCKVARKKYNRKKLHPNTRNPLHTGFKIEEIGKDDYYGFTLDGNRKFLLEDNTVAHNTHNVSVLERHDVNIPTLAQGDGRIIHGYYLAPSTVSEMADGSFDYRHLAETSNFYCRVPSTHQTFSGLFRLFIPASEGLDGFIDSYGYSVKNEILPHQKEEGFTQTADEYLRGKRDILLSKGDPESMRAYREAKKLFPLQYSDCFLGESGDIGFPLEIIDTRLAELRRQDDTVRGNLVWKDGFGSDVEFVTDLENGRFQISQFPLPSVSNKKVQKMGYSTIEGKDIPMWRPLIADKYVLGCDPIKFASKQDAKQGAAIGKRSRLSDGGIAVLLKYDESVDGGKEIRDWKTHKFVASYRYRPANSLEYAEDVLKCAIFYSAMVFPETNIDSILRYFIEKEYEGYLLYEIDVTTGKYKSKAGCDSLERSKQKLFSRLRDYLEFRGHQEDFASFLQECKDIKGMEMMRHFDRLTSHGMCLLGAESPFAEETYGEEDNNLDAADFWDFST